MFRLVRFQAQDASGQPFTSWGAQTDDGIFDLGSGPQRLAEDIFQAISRWDEIAPQAQPRIATASPLSGARLLCPIPEGRKILCIGLNYRDHAIESGMEIPSEPVVFNKLSGTLCGPDDVVPIPSCSRKVDYEAELVLVIGRRAWQVSEAEAEEHIFGYTCGHDVSARDWQLGRPGGQWLLGKSFPHFAPIGPGLVPRQAVADVMNLQVSMRINGQQMQHSSTQQLIFTPPQLVSHISQCCVLEPGDIIFTGTPPGVGAARKPPRFLQSGDVCEVEVEGLGVLRNAFQ